MKILELISERPPISTGMARTIDNIQKGLTKTYHHQLTILTTNDAPKFMFNKLKISFIFIKLLLMKKDFDIVHIHGNTPFFSDVSLFIFWLFRKKMIFTYHCDAMISANFEKVNRMLNIIERIYNYFHRVFMSRADIVTFFTRSYAEPRKNQAKCYAIVPSGIDKIFFTDYDTRKFEKNPRIVLFVGQLQPYKGLDILIDAAKGHNLQVLIAGNGLLLNHVIASTRKMSNIKVLGHVRDDELLELYAKSHFIVLPSNSSAESFGLVTLEGMAGGCIPITSDLPGVSDLSKETGFVFKCGDAQDLSRIFAIAENITDEELKQRSRQSREFAKSYLWDSAVDQYNSVIDVLGRMDHHKRTPIKKKIS
jgi:glycosyltransferase involved in cell wall biosynthesis